MSIRELATYLWMYDVGADENAIMNSDISHKYMKMASELSHSWRNSSMIFVKTISEPSQEMCNKFVYDAGNRFAETTSTDTKTFFRYTYITLFGKEQGPRLPTFINLFGIDNFLNLLDKKMRDPFGIKEHFAI